MFCKYNFVASPRRMSCRFRLAPHSCMPHRQVRGGGIDVAAVATPHQDRQRKEDTAHSWRRTGGCLQASNHHV